MPDDHAADAFGARWWERHYRAGTPGPAGDPTPYVTGELDHEHPGTVLDAGCGTGADAIWLARRGWDVTAVDVSPTAIDRARALAADLATDLPPDGPGGVTWIVADLLTWTPPRQYDAVISQYVHPDVPVDRFVARLAAAVAPGGTLVVVGHEHADSHSAAHAPRDAALGLATVEAALDPGQWTVEVAETRERHVTRGATDLTLTDAVVKARRDRR